MAAVLQGIRVLDLSWGIAGPMTGMLLADHGAEVIKCEPPGGDPFRTQLGYTVWNRGKKSAVYDLKSAGDREAFLALVKTADVLLESYAPGTAEKLGIDYATLSALNPGLVYCSITGYGRGNEHSDRPAYDALVAARSGLHFEQRGWAEGALNHLAGRPDPFADIEIPQDWVQGAPRPGPIFPASYWPSLGAFFNALLGISAALRARGLSGKGQLVETSLLQGAMAGAAGVWMRAENIDAPGFDSWILGNRSPKGHFQCSDGQWIHNWVPNPRFILQASEGETLNATPNLTVQNDPDRFGTGPEELLVMTHYQPILAEAVAKFTAQEWVEAAATAEMTMQPVRTVEASLADPLFLKDGCVVETSDPQLGRIRTVGMAYKLSANPSLPGARAPKVGEHTAEVKAAANGAKTAPSPTGSTKKIKAPLEGITVLDLGLAIAGPFGTQLLSDLGANVIKINGLYDVFWHRVHIAYMANRGKKSITLNLKDPRAMKIFLKLVDSADVVHHNMRYDAAERLKIDYESLKQRNPKLIYCHTRGFETGPRQGLPGNDQTGACLSGIQYEDGGMGRGEGGRPLWSFTSFGDTGNGFLSAVAVVQALYHRDRTGKGQFVDTSIINAALLNTSYAVATPDGKGFERPRTDGMQWGYSAGHRIYETKRGWICLVLANEAHWDGLFTATGLVELAADARFATAAARKTNDEALSAILAEKFMSEDASRWFAKLDAAGVPVEIENETFSLKLHEDAWFKQQRWTTSYEHPHVGKLDQIGLLFSLSDTPGVIQGRPLIVGEHTKEILAGQGYTEEEIKTMEEQFAVGFPGMPRMPPRPAAKA